MNTKTKVGKGKCFPNTMGRTVPFHIQHPRMLLCETWMFMALLRWFLLRTSITQHNVWKNLLSQHTSPKISCIKPCTKQTCQLCLKPVPLVLVSTQTHVFARLAADINGLILPVQKSPWDSSLLQEYNFYCTRYVPQKTIKLQNTQEVAVWQKNDRKPPLDISNTI